MAAEPRDALDHAWKWFDLHAGQRMQLVNFWLLAMSFLIAALTDGFLKGDYPVALGVALAGAVASSGFRRLELRTRELVRLGEEALRSSEDWLVDGTGVAALRLVDEADSHAWKGRKRESPAEEHDHRVPPGTYTGAIRFLHWCAIGGFLAAAAVAAVLWFGDGNHKVSERPACTACTRPPNSVREVP